MKLQFKRMLSVDSPKAVKSLSYGWLNGINYAAPYRRNTKGKNLCSHASAGCIALCLGEHSGQAAMAKQGEISKVFASRMAKADYFLNDRPSFLRELAYHSAKLYKAAKDKGMRACVRPNGSTDIAFESLPLTIDDKLAGQIGAFLGRKVKSGLYRNIMALLPEVQFTDYTKNPKRFARPLPENYSLTFSHSETNKADCLRLLSQGHNVAVVFAHGLPVKRKLWGYPVSDGDKHDLRHLDPKGRVIGLSPKGNKAKKDFSGFVLRDY